jgi:hypothetical protein
LYGASDNLLNEVSGEVGFPSEFCVERVPCGRVRRNAVRVWVIIPTELGGTVRAVKELASGFVEVVAVLIENDDFDRRSSTHLHVSDYAERKPTDSVVAVIQQVAECIEIYKHIIL